MALISPASSANGSVRALSPGSTSSGDIEHAFEELELLDDVDYLEQSDSGDCARDHETRTAPMLTRGAFLKANLTSTQYGVFGSVLSICSKNPVEYPDDRRLYINTNAPFSTVVCGVQGAGKSHTVAVLLENMFITNWRAIGNLQKPLSGLVLHLGEGGPNSRPSEAAWVGHRHPELKDVICPRVSVFVSRSCLKTMRRIYSPLGVSVQPLVFCEAELDAEAFLSLMAVGSSSSAPLYVQVLLSILRELGEKFTYKGFKKQLEVRKKEFNPAQVSGLEQRMSLIQSFVAEDAALQERFAAGKITIVDLSDPFIDPASASSLFEIVTRLFVRAPVKTGKVLVVDEAHKYLGPNKDAGLTKSLLTLTREQRHLAMRVIISTQEPTVIPSVLLDLCTVAILHRFSSPAWWHYIADHVSAQVSSEDAFDKVVKLRSTHMQTGEAIILAPSALALLSRAPASEKQLSPLGRRYLVVKTRRRITADGGASVLVLK